MRNTYIRTLDGKLKRFDPWKLNKNGLVRIGRPLRDWECGHCDNKISRGELSWSLGSNIRIHVQCMKNLAQSIIKLHEDKIKEIIIDEI